MIRTTIGTFDDLQKVHRFEMQELFKRRQLETRSRAYLDFSAAS